MSSRKKVLNIQQLEIIRAFFECVALVNDCGSYTVEWLYTGKTGCFVYNKALKEYDLLGLRLSCN